VGASRTSFEKLQRDRAKKAKAAAKREKRQDRDPDAGADTETPDESLRPAEGDTELSAGELLAMVEDLHKRFEAKKISFEDFEEEKAELMRRLPID